MNAALRSGRAGLLACALFGCSASSGHGEASAKGGLESARAASSASHARAIAAPRNAQVSAPFDIAAVRARVERSFRRRGNGFDARAATLSVAVEGNRVELTPYHAPHAAAREVWQGSPLALETLSIARGATRVDASTAAPAVTHDGALELTRGAVIERFENVEGGLEHGFRFAERPSGSGDLVVRVRAGGLSYRGRTAAGLHFAGGAHGLGFRYGVATFVDARGARRSVTTSYADGVIELRVPAQALDEAAYPAVLDPLVYPEVGLDQPVVPYIGTSETGQAVATASNGTSLVVFEVDDAVAGDIYGARVDASGNVLDPNGIAIASEPYKQWAPAVASNGTDWFVAFQDKAPSSVGELSGVRVSASGAVLDTLPLALGPTGYAAQLGSVSSDGTNYLVAWTLERAGSIDPYTGVPYDTYNVTRVSASGSVLDPNGILLDASSRSTSNPVQLPHIALAYDGTRWIAAYAVRFVASGTEGIESTIIDSAGHVFPGSGAFSIDGAGQQEAPAVACEGTSCFAAWHGPDGIWGRTFDGSSQQPQVLLADGSELHSAPSVAFDGTNWVAGWVGTLESTGVPMIEWARVSENGDLVDSSPVNTGIQGGPVALTSMPSGALAVWAPYGTGASGTFAALLQARAPSPFPVSYHPALEHNPAVAASDGGWLVVWLDDRDSDAPAGSFPIYGTRVDPTGAVLDPSGIRIAASTSHQPRLASDGTNWLVAWADYRNQVDYDTYGARVLADGGVPDGDGFLIAGGSDEQIVNGVADDGRRWLVSWSADTAAPSRAARVARNGTVLDPDGFDILTGGAVVAGGDGEWLAARESNHSDLTSEIDGQRIGDDGTVLDPTPFTIFHGPEDVELEGVVAAYGSGRWLVVFGGEDGMVRGLRVDPGGALLDQDPIPISTLGFAKAPIVAYDGSEWLVAWSDWRSWPLEFNEPPLDVYGTRVDAAGAVLDGDGFAITTTTGVESELAIAGAHGRWLLAYDEFAGLVSEVRARFVAPDCGGGSSTDTDSDGVPDCRDACPELPGAGSDGCPLSEGGAAGDEGVSAGGTNGGVAGEGAAQGGAGVIAVGGASSGNSGSLTSGAGPVGEAGEGGNASGGAPAAGGTGPSAGGARNGGSTGAGGRAGARATGGVTNELGGEGGQSTAGGTSQTGGTSPGGAGKSGRGGTRGGAGGAGTSSSGASGQSGRAGSSGSSGSPAPDSGCGCSVPSSRGDQPWALALLALGAAVARRRSARGRVSL